MTLSERLRDLTLIHRGDLTLAYRAWDSALERPVFVKVLNPALSADTEVRGRFEREAKAVARLDHPNLVRIFDYGHDAQLGLYMIFEWVEGQSLAERLKVGGPMDAVQVEEMARQLLSGLSALHTSGIVHRDLKPDNILIRAPRDAAHRETVYRITDFSLAAWRDAPRLTHHEAIVGTPAYMAPEQAAGATPTPSSDLFSLGVILHEAATGRNPFVGETLLATLKNVREREIPNEELPTALRSLLALLLHKDPGKRPPTASAAISTLEGESPGERPRLRVRNARYLGAAVLVVLVGVLLVVLQPRPTRDRTTSEMQGSPTFSIQSQPEFRPPPSGGEDSAATAEAAPIRNEVPVKPAIHSEDDENVLKQKADGAAERPDSSWLTLTTEPWAHVFLGDSQVGTTPFPGPIRLPSGTQRLLLRNPAYPPITLLVDVTEPTQRLAVRLAERVALLRATVEPWAELYLDGEHVATTPLAKPLFVSPGYHSVRLTHPQFPALVQEFSVSAGETLVIQADFAQRAVSLRSETQTPQ